MKQQQLNIFSGSQLATAGMELAKDHADSVSPGWSERVWDQFKEWLAGQEPCFVFQMEDFRKTAETPPKGQAFGFVTLRAKKENLIEYAGSARTKDPVSHCRPSNLWRKK